MKITNVNIEADKNLGLDAIKMNKLGSVVLIAGKNGAGKTRILSQIFTMLNQKPKKEEFDKAKSALELHETNLKKDEKLFEALSLKILSDIDLKDEVDELKRSIQELNWLINSGRSLIGWDMIITDEILDKYGYLRYVPKNQNLTDSNSFNKAQIIQIGNQKNVGVDNLESFVLTKIQYVQDLWFNALHPMSSATQEEKLKATNDYRNLQDIVRAFLNTEITRSHNDEAQLFGLPMGKANFSDGQRILLQYCLAIYSQGTALKDLVLILDEPENHLHPSIIIETIDRISKCATNGQIWIATHSIPILAHFDPSLIWFVESGKITHAGKIPEKVLHSLLGNEDEIGRLQDFIGLPAQYATNRYAFESLLEPKAVDTDSNDPQSRQIRANLLKLAINGKIRILDYGAGKGRLISNIADLDETSQDKLIEQIDYIAYDEYSTDKQHCEAALIKAYGNCENRYYNEIDKLLSKYDKESFGVIIMCNVLHEIDPKDWLKLFQKDGTISSLLNRNGILLLVEDHQMPIGEKAYQKGFLVLDTPQLKELFKITEKDKDFSFNEEKDGRLKAHQIPKRYLIQIDAASRLSAIKSMSTKSRDEILKIRAKDKNYSNGKLHGFWTQQFANAQLNLAELANSTFE